MTPPAAAARAPTWPALDDGITADGLHLQRGGERPLYIQIEQALREAIVTGSWPTHHKLPPEPDLAAQLGVNRGTLRRALSELAAAGLLVARRGRGTFVAPLTPEPSIAQRFRSLSEDFTAQGFDFSRQVLSITAGRLPLPVRTVLGVSDTAEGMRLERVFTTSDGPLAYLINYVCTDTCPSVSTVDFTRASLFAALAASGIAITSGRRTFSAQAASSTVADALRMDSGDAVLYLEQVSYTDAGQPIEYSDVWINSTKVTITSILQRD